MAKAKGISIFVLVFLRLANLVSGPIQMLFIAFRRNLASILGAKIHIFLILMPKKDKVLGKYNENQRSVKK